jgi:hypothetical protein
MAILIKKNNNKRKEKRKKKQISNKIQHVCKIALNEVNFDIHIFLIIEIYQILLEKTTS